ncbi:MAG: hypothetical protein COS11_01275 [bacterium (Candidatus Ratteibacteria) CG01_land_8_20_14_3_00_40_19]|uniref:NADH:ubiquinone oxidoreductase 30kDa subunit domain-containing protein n=1 Tax=bacterium (Candidatus Ratteibacteria) CG01_land_8_20_14_3_00_40_19 TaxID=2014290 RepID=A0A2M7EA80_9BACT|nr:MAG: hypothetical protein COS11_01275 [bacterium (Candidatus Ratteibacteria) CG01_land_8_20_14_3_00_40_19]
MEKTLNSIKEKFSQEILKFEEKSLKRYYILIDKKDLLKLVKFIFNDLKARFIIETGLDTPEGIEILYHFSFDKLGKVVSIRTLLSREKPEVESISPVIKGAQWIEREIQDILGVKFLNHPDPRRFILADDWPEGKYPYRKESS